MTMIEYRKKVLANGLTVIAHTDHSTPMAAVNILYNVGSKHEDPQHTGFAHLFEHLMFGGSRNVPDFDMPIQMASGENNAFTNNDYTNYYIALPQANLSTALWVESDRMRDLTIAERGLQVQRKVVVEEFAQRYLNQPYGDIWLLLRPLAYTVHPYRWATIGMSTDHIQGATLEQVQQFYDRYYNPSNAILSIAAGLECDEIFDLAEQWFGGIISSACAVKSGVSVVEPVQAEQRRLEVVRDVPVSVIYIAFHMGGRCSEEYQVCDVMSDVLSNGTSSRLYQRLVKQQTLFSSVNAYLTGEVDCGLFVVTGRVIQGGDVAVAEAALWQELRLLIDEPIDIVELQKVKNKFEANNIFSQINVMNKAMNLAYFELLGDAGLINTEVEDHGAVTAEQIMETAERVFRVENSSVLHYLSESARADAATR